MNWEVIHCIFLFYMARIAVCIHILHDFFVTHNGMGLPNSDSLGSLTNEPSESELGYPATATVTSKLNRQIFGQVTCSVWETMLVPDKDVF